ncbi:MAG TPA: hypothetical protein VK657_01830, partial [Terriglobales bacterium]|nr:hypothetical protein [Terriglobales bacterium]
MSRLRSRIASTPQSSINYPGLIVFALILALGLAGCAGSSSSASNNPGPAPGPGGTTPPPGGGGGTPPPPPPPASNPELVYVANAMNDTLSAFQINSSGGLQPVAGSPLSAAPAKSV